MEKFKLNTNQKYVMSVNSNRENCGNLSISFKIKGKLDKVRFEQSIQKTIDNNDSFRFKMHKDENTKEIYQTIYECVKYTLVERKVEGNSYDDKLKNVEKEIQKIYSNVKFFDNLLWDFVLFEMGDDEFIFWGRVNHIITDGVSLSLTFASIRSYYLGEKVKQSNSYRNYLIEQESWGNSKIYLDKLEKYGDKLNELEKYKSIINISPNNIKKTKIDFSYFATIGGEKLFEFCKQNKMSLFHICLYLFHASLSVIYHRKDIRITVPVGTRKYDYANTIGCLSSMCWSRLIFHDNMSMREAAIICRNNYFENLKMGILITEIIIKSRQPLDFVITYQNQIANFQKSIPFDEASIEFITDADFGKEGSEMEKVILALSAVETDNSAIITLIADKNVFPVKKRNDAQKAFELAVRCLTEQDMTFFEYCKMMDS